MKVCIVMAKVEELQARSVDKAFHLREKAERYEREQERDEQFVNLSGFDRSREEWEVE
jgi:hypothetical protein